MGSSNARRRNKQQRREYGAPIHITTPATDQTYPAVAAPTVQPAESAPAEPESEPGSERFTSRDTHRETQMTEDVPLPPRSNSSTNGNQSNHGRHTGQQTPTPASELTPLLDSLRAIFINDRAVGSRADVGRCGICYLIFAREELHFHEEEGFYACETCETALGTARLPMVHRQRK